MKESRFETGAHRRQRARALEAIRSEARPFADTSPEARARRRALPFFDWCSTYLPHYFSASPWSKHIQAERHSHEQGMPQFHCWSRGAGKSTIFSLAKPLSWILAEDSTTEGTEVHGGQKGSDADPLCTSVPSVVEHRRRHFIILGGATEDVAIDKSDFIKLELEENPRLRSDYGEEGCLVVGEAGARVMGDTLVWCRGIGQSTRGQRHRQWRPDAFVGDDLENDVLVRNPKREDELWDWLIGATFPGLEAHGAKALFIVVGTMYGRHCLMMRAREASQQADPNGRPICRYFEHPLRDARGRSTWPERYSDDDLARACAIMGTRIARREIDCKEDDQDAPFRPEWIQELQAARVDRAGLHVVAHLDPSAKAGEQHDYKAIVVLGMPDPCRTQNAECGAEELVANAAIPHSTLRTPHSPIFCLHAWVRRASPMEMIEQLFRIDEQYQPAVIGCEANGFQSLIWELLDIEQQRRGRALTVKPVQNRQNKQDRILSNQGEFERGLCFFDPRESDQRLLIDQFLDFGKPSVHDDGPDAWDCARRLLPGRGATFFYEGAPRRDPMLGAGLHERSWAPFIDSDDQQPMNSPFAM